MSLKQSVVIVNEFTYKPNGSSGTRGDTPGEYVLRYMSRPNATEDVTPTRVREVDPAIQKYINRAKASNEEETIPKMKHAMRKAQKKGGVAFSNDDPSLSDEKLRQVSKFLQQDFDRGKTVMKTILSFEEDWLREHGILEEDFELKKKGDFRGHVDQLKLRMAVMAGLRRMGQDFDDLRYVGCIQVDTKHLHVHLAMVDHGVGNLCKDGTQRGKLTEANKRKLRRGMDEYLDRKQMVRAMSSSVMYDKRNALCYIKKFTHKTMAQQGLPQFLLACLPQDRRLWRASTHRKEMRKANAIVREFVVNLLESPESGYMEAVQDIQRYASYRKDREGLTEQDYRKLVRDGQEQLLTDCMNGVYAVLKQIPRSAFVVETPMMDVMSMDYEEMASQAVNSPLMEFGFKLRSYSSRLNHHRKEYHKYRDEYRNYEETPNKAEDSKPLGDYLRVERNYQAMLMTKYQYFLSFLPPDKEIEEEFEELMKRKTALAKLKAMKEDPSFNRMKPRAAYDYGVRVYQQVGGDKVKYAPKVFDLRIQALEMRIEAQERVFQEHLIDAGLYYDGHGVTRKKLYAFDDVKALDLHHLGYDFPYDCRVSKINVDRFKEMANLRYQSFQEAKSYLVRSGQEAAVSLLPESDVVFMKQYADKLVGETNIQSIRPENGQMRRSVTVRLGRDYVTSMENVVKSTVRSVQMEETL